MTVYGPGRVGAYTGRWQNGTYLHDVVVKVAWGWATTPDDDGYRPDGPNVVYDHTDHYRQKVYAATCDEAERLALSAVAARITGRGRRAGAPAPLAFEARVVGDGCPRNIVDEG